MEAESISKSGSKNKGKKGSFGRYLPLTLIALPGLIYLFINNYIPMFGLFIAFKNINFEQGIFKSPWTGFQNFEFLFKTPDAFIITRNTLLYNAGFIIIGTVCAVFLAIVLNEVTKMVFLRIYQSVLLLPYMISYVIVSYLAYAFLAPNTGFLNDTVLKLFGMQPVMWYNTNSAWPFILNIVNLWKGVGYSTIIFFASVIGIDKEYYEAATLDGASKWQQIKSITLPLIKPTIIMIVLILVGRIFYSDFGLFYQVPMDSGAVFPSTNVIDTYVYRGLIETGNISMSAAAGLYQAVVGFVLVLGANLLTRKLDADSALF